MAPVLLVFADLEVTMHCGVGRLVEIIISLLSLKHDFSLWCHPQGKKSEL